MKTNLTYLIILVLGLSCKPINKEIVDSKTEQNTIVVDSIFTEKQFNNKKITNQSNQILQNGLILPKDIEAEAICCIYTPKAGFAIYNKPNGTKTGLITRHVKQNQGDQAAYNIFFVIIKTKQETKINSDFIKEIGYEIYALAYFERKNGLISIICKSLLSVFILNKSYLISYKRAFIH